MYSLKRSTALKILSAAAVPLFLAGCGSDEPDITLTSTTTAPPEVPVLADPQVRVVHASADAPTVNILANGAVLNGLSGVDYQQASGLFSVGAAEYELAVEANTPAGGAQVLSLTASLEGEMVYNVIAAGSVAAGNLEALVVANQQSEVTAGNARVQVVHAARNAPTVDIYVTAPDAALDAAQPLVTLGYSENTGYVEVPAGDYRVRVTAVGSKVVAYDSGTLPLGDGADLLVAATTNVATGTSPISLLINDGTNTSVALDADSPAHIRAIHGVADAPAVDVVANNALVLFDGAPFLGVTGYAAVPADDYLIDIRADADESIVPIDDAPVTLEAGVFYTALANNSLANIDLDLIVDMPRSIATAAQVRIFHASEATPAVDIYVTADGDIADVEPAFSNVMYMTAALAETGYVELAAGSYVVTVTPTGTKDAAIETGVLNLEAGNIYTAFAVNGNMAGDAPQLILADDF